MTRLRKRLSLGRFGADERGGSAAELVLIMIPLVALTLGTINLAMMIYTVANLHYATEEAARCATVRSAVCADSPSLTTYALKNYGGLTAAPTFTLVVEPKTATVCPNGNYVTATATYHFVTGFTTTAIPLTANACYPLP